MSSPSAERNRGPILEVMAQVLPASGDVLEIASGSGQHAAWFAAAHPGLRWQPSECSPEALASIAAWVAYSGLSNLLPPLDLDVRSDDWAAQPIDVLVNINMIHISPWEASVALIGGAGRALRAGGLLFMYGPYLVADRETAPSNLGFDQWLRSRDPRWGLRWLHDVERLADANGLTLERTFDMPANNLSVVYRKR